MSTGSISLDILLNKILTDAISGGNESINQIASAERVITVNNAVQ